MKFRTILILVMITGLLLCIISVSPVTALVPKISKSLASLEEKNLSPTTYTLKKTEGTKFFDGMEIIQSPEVISSALIKLKSGGYLNEGDVESEDMAEPQGVPYYSWTLRQFADYLAENSSRTILYTLIRTNGDYYKETRGVLGYSPSTDLIIGDKYNQYSLLCPVYPDCNLHPWPGGPLRLIIDPDVKNLIIQDFFSESLSPDEEETIMIEHFHSKIATPNGFPNCFLGKSVREPPIVIISLWPYPLPE